MLHVLAEEYPATSERRRGEQQAIPPGQMGLVLNSPGPPQYGVVQRRRAAWAQGRDVAARGVAAHHVAPVGDHPVAFI